MGGRSLQTQLRKIYDQQSAFVYAFVRHDETLIDFFDKEKPLPVSLLRINFAGVCVPEWKADA